MSLEISDAEFDLLKGYLHTKCGIEVPPEKRYLFVTRLGDYLAEQRCTNFSEFYHRLNTGGDAELHKQLIEAMTTHETGFFRDGHPFETLRDEILPALAARRQAEHRYTPPRLRIWSVGCATGEEPYTVAMCVYDWLATQSFFTRNDVTILAVDISKTALAQAQQGIFNEGQLRKGLSDYHRQTYLQHVADGWRVREDVRAMVYFAELNLSEPFEHLGYFDLILCRNVIIYFSLDIKRQIVDAFYRMLNPGGVLLMGASETTYQLSDRFRAVHAGPTTYYHRDAEPPA